MTMKYILRLIRFPNLAIIILTMFLIRYGIIQAILIKYGIDFEFSLPGFIILTLAVAMVAAAGYMINDYFDVKIDLINRKDKTVVGTFITPQTVYKSYIIINIIALCLAAYVSLKAGKFSLFIIFPLTVGALWFYSTAYKKQVLIGNLLVSVLTAMVPVLILLYEMPLIYVRYHMYTDAYNILIKVMLGWCGMYALFAFLITFVRELIKDIEDFEGDMVSDRKTLPIVYGLPITKILVAILILMVALLIEFLFFTYLKITCTTAFDSISFFYFHLFIIIPLLASLLLLFTAKDKKDYAISSSMVKLVMVAGIFYAVVVRFNIIKCL